MVTSATGILVMTTI